MNDFIGFRGNLTLTLTAPDGTVKETRTANSVKTPALYGVLDQLLASPTLTKPGWMAIGTSTPGATLLGAEVARAALTSKSRALNVITFTSTWGPGVGTGAITEAGLFDVVTANSENMWLAANFAVVNKMSLDSLTITWDLTAAAV